MIGMIGETSGSTSPWQTFNDKKITVSAPHRIPPFLGRPTLFPKHFPNYSKYLPAPKSGEVPRGGNEIVWLGPPSRVAFNYSTEVALNEGDFKASNLFFPLAADTDTKPPRILAYLYSCSNSYPLKTQKIHGEINCWGKFHPIELWQFISHKSTKDPWRDQFLGEIAPNRTKRVVDNGNISYLRDVFAAEKQQHLSNCQTRVINRIIERYPSPIKKEPNDSLVDGNEKSPDIIPLPNDIEAVYATTVAVEMCSTSPRLPKAEVYYTVESQTCV
ncbi:uncharacterized protein CDAR_574851 [Caerostris darwini]|uniref:Uncharacterized protein n=1 Tax=Caerostris darwini TaxID=1538125 RepID=A0AAV4T1I6_9ARAC|nr:uncharacterized protein CDAR_574851 [Caerostris darwini]